MKNQTICPIARETSVVKGEHYRFTVLTERLLRMEYSPNGIFEDRCTTMAINRDFPTPEFTVKDEEDKLEIVTKAFRLTYDKKPFSHQGLFIRLQRNQLLRKQETWFYGDTSLDQAPMGQTGGNLRGTLRELGGTAETRPEIPNGLMSTMGFTVVYDSDSSIIEEDGWVVPGIEGHEDVYFLAYGRDYLGCLKDFYHLSGKQPMLPRYALGNWWSRYYSYTDSEYLELMDRFRDEGYPFSVAIMDMGWHYVNIDPKYGKGWSGYSWNRELFPDPEKFISSLKERGMAVSLNLHPADGVRAHEDAYPEMARALGIDPATEAPINFDVTSREFWKAYFEYLHHPQEEIGVDFWWMDWQQGNYADIPGYDPLWLLNQYHYEDNGRNGKRAMAFSRYAGLGSHRYPVGFSSSTRMEWDALDFQPYFTSTASNVGYGWWSHDIGGHAHGIHDDELSTRWLQFGVFSPITRLHSGNTVFSGKEPWKYNRDAQSAMRYALRLRHRLVPYLYTMNYRAWKEDRPLVEPMYYRHAYENAAYSVPNEYYFGSELIVSPITVHTDYELQAAPAKTWLPEGLWFDLFTGMVYTGDRTVTMYRTMDSIPVLAKAGSVIPLQAESELSTSTANPTAMDLLVLPGESGSFTLYEDDGISMGYLEGNAATTEYRLDWSEKTFTILAAEGDLKLIPEKRSYAVSFYGLKDNSVERVQVNSRSVDFAVKYDADKHILTVMFEAVSSDERVVVYLRKDAEICKNDNAYYAFKAINRANIEMGHKETLYKIITSGKDVVNMLSEVSIVPVSESVKKEMLEIITAMV